MSGNIGVILAGGQSRRMGESKAAMMLGGEPLLARVARRLSPAVDELLVIGPPSLAPLAPQARVVEDALPAQGPLGGLYTALTATKGARIFLVACDMPFIRSSLVKAMLAIAEARDDAYAVSLNANERVQPLHAVYSPKCLPVVERALRASDHSLHTLLAHLAVVAIDTDTVRREDPDGLSAFNVNTPDDWRQALHLAEHVDRHNSVTGDQ